MALYLLERIGDTGYDQVKGWVIRAANAQQARQMAAGEDSIWDSSRLDAPGRLVPNPLWLDAQQSHLTYLGMSGIPLEPAAIILRSFVAG